MPIRVTCGNCHTRFDVSEKFAGKEGPCPKCKKVIRIPTEEEQVVVHEVEHSGPKDSTGQSVLKPIARSETDLSGVQITLIVCTILAFLAGAVVLRFMFPDKVHFPIYMLAIGAAIMSIPIAYVGYAFLRNQEAAPFHNNELWKRLGICAAVYSLLWFIMPLMGYAFPGSGNNLGSIFGIVGMIGIGGAIGMFTLDFDYLFGILHYGMYLGLCLLARIIIGLQVLPGAFGESKEMPSTVISMLLQTAAWPFL